MHLASDWLRNWRMNKNKKKWKKEKKKLTYDPDLTNENGECCWDWFPDSEKWYTRKMQTFYFLWISSAILYASGLPAWDEADPRGDRRENLCHLWSCWLDSTVPVACLPADFQWSYDKPFWVGFESCICYWQVHITPNYLRDMYK